MATFFSMDQTIQFTLYPDPLEFTMAIKSKSLKSVGLEAWTSAALRAVVHYSGCEDQSVLTAGWLASQFNHPQLMWIKTLVWTDGYQEFIISEDGSLMTIDLETYLVGENTPVWVKSQPFDGWREILNDFQILQWWNQFDPDNWIAPTKEIMKLWDRVKMVRPRIDRRTGQLEQLFYWKAKEDSSFLKAIWPVCRARWGHCRSTTWAAAWSSMHMVSRTLWFFRPIEKTNCYVQVPAKYWERIRQAWFSYQERIWNGGSYRRDINGRNSGGLPRVFVEFIERLLGIPISKADWGTLYWVRDEVPLPIVLTKHFPNPNLQEWSELNIGSVHVMCKKPDKGSYRKHLWTRQYIKLPGLPYAFWAPKSL